MRIVNAETGDLSSETARILLQLDFSSVDRRRMNALAQKASTGTLTARERKAAEAYNRVAHVLALLQSKARKSLRPGKTR